MVVCRIKSYAVSHSSSIDFFILSNIQYGRLFVVVMMRVLAVNFEDFQALLFGFYLEKVPAASNSPASSSGQRQQGKRQDARSRRD